MALLTGRSHDHGGIAPHTIRETLFWFSLVISKYNIVNTVPLPLNFVVRKQETV